MGVPCSYSTVESAAGINVDMLILAAGIIVAGIVMRVQRVTVAGVIMGVLVLAAGAIGSVGMLIISALGVDDIARGCAPTVITVPRALYIYVVLYAGAVDLTILGV